MSRQGLGVTQNAMGIDLNTESASFPLCVSGMISPIALAALPSFLQDLKKEARATLIVVPIGWLNHWVLGRRLPSFLF